MSYTSRQAQVVAVQQQIDRIMNALETQPAGVVRVNIGDTTVSYDRPTLLKELEHFESKLAKLKRGSRFTSLDLSGGLGGSSD